MSRVFLDSNILIYIVEDDSERGDRARLLMRNLRERNDEIFTSTLTVGEVMVGPMKSGDAGVLAMYDALFASRGVTVEPFSLIQARAFASIRTDRTIRAADGIQLATAAVGKCTLFVTNDEALTRKSVPGIGFIVTLDNCPI